MIVLGGLAFEAEPTERLSAAECEVLDRLSIVSGSEAPGRGDPPFVLKLEEGPGLGPPSEDDLGAATIDWDGTRVRIRHRRLDATLDPFAGRGRLRRDASLGWPLEVTLRTALAARLPLQGGLPLHAAGVVVDGLGVAFFGPSGAGKSTIAGTSPHPVLSDEMVAIVPAPVVSGRPGSYGVAGTGFWGTLGQRAAPAGLFPLAALFELDRGPGTRTERLDSREATRRLIASVLVPPAPPLWAAALSSIGHIARGVPVMRLAWNPAEPPWPAIEAALCGAR